MTTTERIALLFSDDSMSLLRETATIDEARAERDCDSNEVPERRAKIMKVVVQKIELIEELKPAPSGICPACGR